MFSRSRHKKVAEILVAIGTYRLITPFLLKDHEDDIREGRDPGISRLAYEDARQKIVRAESQIGEYCAKLKQEELIAFLAAIKSKCLESAKKRAIDGESPLELYKQMEKSAILETQRLSVGEKANPILSVFGFEPLRELPQVEEGGIPRVERSQREEQATQGNADTQVCPYCAEEIKSMAIKCRFCGEWLGSRMDGE